MNKDLWSEDLREDFATYSSWNRILTGAPNPVEQAMIKRNKVINDFLRKKYADLIEKYSTMTFDEKTCPKIAPEDYKIFYCWLQGEESLPPLARCCYNSWKMNAGNREIVFINEKNLSDYVDLPEHIMKKFRTGGITRAHFADILRVNLLERYGGLWLDATILVTEPLDNYKEFWELPYFTQTYTHEKSKYAGSRACASYSRWGSYAQGTNIRHNPLFTFVRDIYYEYWRDFDELIDYLLFDCMMNLAYDNIPFVKQEIDAVPINNTKVGVLASRLALPYNSLEFDNILKDNFLHKVSAKLNFDTQKEGTFFKEIQRRYAPETLK